MSHQEEFRWRQVDKRLSALESSNADAHQRLARVWMPGKVTQIREAAGDWQVRLDLGLSADEGKAVLSPWIPVQPVGSGQLKIKVKPSIGERMGMLSPSGTIGPDSWAMRGPFDQDHPAPAGSEDVVLERGTSRLTIEDGRIMATTGEATIELAGGAVRVNGKDVAVDGKIALTGETLTHNDANISADHTHTKVMPGGGLSGPPAPV
ncbi:hypothetical protein [Ancylobacter sp. TS-1]|uniref:hypothetical protein n=1 Tax=Ancylobacter sp. TS-1 TaxID=1850374 RepID=UPI001265ABBA|nr:hypothetical protein [Ancylobacter sp. TS-1]QFR32383.1 hypothetical protein GBB76_04220 [Ancylobacter sp. TS-1]